MCCGFCSTSEPDRPLSYLILEPTTRLELVTSCIIEIFTRNALDAFEPRVISSAVLFLSLLLCLPTETSHRRVRYCLQSGHHRIGHGQSAASIETHAMQTELTAVSDAYKKTWKHWMMTRQSLPDRRIPMFRK
jgi:hypothetical protein